MKVFKYFILTLILYNLLYINIYAEDINSTEDHIHIERDNSAKEYTILFGGDVYLSEYVLNKYNSHGIDGILDKNIQNLFLNDDITMINQEFAFSQRGKKAPDKKYTFRVNPSYGKIFNEMNVDVVSLANNHTLDFGPIALDDSFTTLNNLDIKYVGAGKNLDEAKAPVDFKINNKNIAMLGATRVIPVYGWNATNKKSGVLTTYDPSKLVTEITKAKKKNKYVVAYIHWGVEKAERPERYQRDLAKKYIDAGADLVVGSHPHVLQGIEYYKGKPIVYSLGNLIFYNSISQTAILRVVINENNETKIKILPCKAYNSKTTLITNNVKKEKFYRYLQNISFDVEIDKDGNVRPKD
ncbi:MAG: CapA family protein [Lachnospirales bacterium]